MPGWGSSRPRAAERIPSVTFLRRAIARPVVRKQLMVIEEGKALQPLVALELRKQRLVQRLQAARIGQVEPLAPARIVLYTP